MGTQLQGTIIAVLKERLAVKPQEFFCFLDGDPSSVFCHGAEKRVLLYRTRNHCTVKTLNKGFGFLLFLDTR